MKKILFVIGLVAGLLFAPGIINQFMRDYYVPTQVVQLYGIADGRCSGVHIQIKDKTYILSASHCLVLQNDNGEIYVGNEEMEPMPRKVLKEDDLADVILLEPLPGVKGLSLADNIEQTEHIYTYTHGLGYATYKTEGSYIQDVKIQVPLFVVSDQHKCDISKPKYVEMDINLGFFSLRACVLIQNTMVTEAFVAPGSSGGAVTNKYGELVGIVSAEDSYGFGYLVTLKDLQRFLSKHD